MSAHVIPTSQPVPLGQVYFMRNDGTLYRGSPVQQGSVSVGEHEAHLGHDIITDVVAVEEGALKIIEAIDNPWSAIVGVALLIIVGPTLISLIVWLVKSRWGNEKKNTERLDSIYNSLNGNNHPNVTDYVKKQTVFMKQNRRLLLAICKRLGIRSNDV